MTNRPRVYLSDREVIAIKCPRQGTFTYITTGGLKDPRDRSLRPTNTKTLEERLEAYMNEDREDDN